MSAFYCNNRTLSRITDFVYAVTYVNNGNIQTNHELSKAIRQAKAIDRESIFQMLSTMNINALKERYGENTEGMIPENDAYDKYASGTETGPEWLYGIAKNLDCYLYQCAEGEVDKTDLYKGLQALRNRLGEFLVSNDSRYDEEPWGVTYDRIKTNSDIRRLNGLCRGIR